MKVCQRGHEYPDRKKQCPVCQVQVLRINRRGPTPLEDRCEICGSTERLGRDHNHDCHPHGMTCERCRRGTLCQLCNMALGCVEDNPAILKAMIRYLAKWKLPD